MINGYACDAGLDREDADALRIHGDEGVNAICFPALSLHRANEYDAHPHVDGNEYVP